MKTIPLTRSYIALVDDEDFERLNQFKWHALVQPKAHSIKVYACRRERGSRKSNRIYIRMHRDILMVPNNLQIDHINGNSLDNRKENLRIVTNQQNQFNTRSKNNKTGYKGVTYMPWVRGARKYYARVMLNGRYISCGYHPTAYEAAIAYDKKALELFGEYAKTNL